MHLKVDVLCHFVRDLRSFEIAAGTLHEKAPNSRITDADAAGLAPVLEFCNDADAFFYLPATVARRQRLEEWIRTRGPYTELRTHMQVLWETLQDELTNRTVFYVPAKQATSWWAGPRLLGEMVEAKFPNLNGDIDEAGKCMAMTRHTAAVFHLMRVLEAGVREFGNKLGVANTDERTWQPILNDINTAIARMEKNAPERVVLAELATLLFAVKLAWRNEVMHPKATYTEEEAENILAATKAFMGKLAAAL
jgi:hypothetical protein